MFHDTDRRIGINYLILDGDSYLVQLAIIDEILKTIDIHKNTTMS